MTRHTLKTDPLVFAAVRAGLKTHEIRLNDRSFAVGDELELRETLHSAADMAANPGLALVYTGETVMRTISHIQTGYGLADGWCILSFAAGYPARFNDQLREAVRDTLSAALGQAMDCTRVWSAWQYRTMSENDFQLLADNDERLDELVDAIETAIAPAAQHAESGAQATCLREGFDKAFLSLNSFHTRSELDAEWKAGSLSGEMFRAGAALAAQSQGAQSLPELPTNEVLEELWETTHYGHPADFAADVLQRWGGWQAGLLGYGGKLNPPLAAQQAAAPGALAAIAHKTRPGQALDIDAAIDLICEVHVDAKRAAPSAPGTPEASTRHTDN